MVAVHGLHIQADLVSDTATIVEFGRFRILPHRRELLADGRPIRIGGRAFDVLMVLIDARGSVVAKDTLMDRVWPDTIVEENNLQAQIAALRSALGSDRDLIRTIVGRGYQFIGEIRIAPPDPARSTIAQVTGGAAFPADEPSGTGFGSDRSRRRTAGNLEPSYFPSAGHTDRCRRHRKDSPRPRRGAPIAAELCRRGLGCRTRAGC
jgi:DNA-binding winged helix-turn-helix (wHTH) protein